ncbi:MAG: hypothetical protein NVSMB18_24980 [Acetobacteraceae bacterium]
MKLVHVAALCFGFWVAAAHAAGPVWHRSATLDYEVAADGTSVAQETWEVRADTASVAHTIAQQTFSFIADMEQVELLEAYTQKSDGRRIPVAAESVLAQAVSTSASAPQFSAAEARTIVFPSVAAGDTVHYALRRRSHETLFPGRFTLTLTPGGWDTTERTEITIAAPAGMALRVETAGLDELPGEPAGAGRAVRRWGRSAQRAGSLSLDVSSFDDYAEVGRAYAVRAWPRSQPGAGVRALAARLAGGAGDRREIARRLYRYVSSEIRYVATFLGQGRVVPRAAETVLAEGWGDCKDHAALLQALLAAEGIEAQPALISLRDLYTLPLAPGLGALDHVITFVPELDLFLDSTAAYAPFGLLPAGEYDKPVVLASPEDAHLARTPTMPPAAVLVSTRTTARVGDDDVLRGRTTTAASGPQGIALRSMAAWFERRGTATAAASQLQQAGTPGTGGFRFEPPEEVAAEYSVEGRFVLDDALTDAGEAPFALPGGLGILGRPGRVLLSAAATAEGGRACFPGREIEEIALELPAGALVLKLPREVDVQAGGARYRARYAVQDGVLHAWREFALETTHQFCTQDEFAPMLAVVAAAKQDQHAHIALVRSGRQQVAHRE